MKETKLLLILILLFIIIFFLNTLNNNICTSPYTYEQTVNENGTVIPPNEFQGHKLITRTTCYKNNTI